MAKQAAVKAAAVKKGKGVGKGQKRLVSKRQQEINKQAAFKDRFGALNAIRAEFERKKRRAGDASLDARDAPAVSRRELENISKTEYVEVRARYTADLERWLSNQDPAPPPPVGYSILPRSPARVAVLLLFHAETTRALLRSWKGGGEGLGIEKRAQVIGWLAELEAGSRPSHHAPARVGDDVADKDIVKISDQVPALQKALFLGVGEDSDGGAATSPPPKTDAMSQVMRVTHTLVTLARACSPSQNLVGYERETAIVACGTKDCRVKPTYAYELQRLVIIVTPTRADDDLQELLRHALAAYEETGTCDACGRDGDDVKIGRRCRVRKLLLVVVDRKLIKNADLDPPDKLALGVNAGSHIFVGAACLVDENKGHFEVLGRQEPGGQLVHYTHAGAKVADTSLASDELPNVRKTAVLFVYERKGASQNQLVPPPAAVAAGGDVQPNRTVAAAPGGETA